VANDPKRPAESAAAALDRHYSQTFGVTQTLERDILEFLSSKYTKNATLSVQEVMALYKCPEDRARRVIANLVRDRVIVEAGRDIYKVVI
jgi:uncharacterized SAM-dependent methyltransferase